ncbi:MAG: putative ABC transport system permease protein [Saprospiraceae bacterium]|jgi:putative ABC transport system permease protein
MNSLFLSWKNLTAKPLSMLLTLVLFALGVGLISLLMILQKQTQDQFDKNLAGIDLVVGAKGSKLQLILGSMYHVDNPTGNITIREARPFMNPKHPLIEMSVPLSLGDSHKGYRIVGTEKNILELYNAKIGEGKLWNKVMEVTLGASVAADLNKKIGDRFKSSHGLIEDDNLIHEDSKDFVVTGILQPTGSVIDQLVLTRSESIWEVHDDHAHDEKENDHAHEETASDDHSGHEHHDHAEGEHDHAAEENTSPKTLLDYPDKSITSLLIKFKGRGFQTLNMGRQIDQNTDMIAASPAIEINRLYANMGVGINGLTYLAYLITFVSALSIFISLFSSLKDRKYELALMRVMGASRGKVFGLILAEGLLLAILGCFLGLLLSHVGMHILAGYMKESYRYTFSGMTFLKEEYFLIGGALLLGIVAAFIPAIQASQTDISETLGQG